MDLTKSKTCVQRKYYQESEKKNQPKTQQEDNNQIQKQEKDLTFLQKRYTNDRQNIKRCSTTLVIREMQIKTKYHFTPTKMAFFFKFKTEQTTSIGDDVEKILKRCWWTCKMVQQLRKTVQWLLKKLYIELLYNPAIPLLDR